MLLLHYSPEGHHLPITLGAPSVDYSRRNYHPKHHHVVKSLNTHTHTDRHVHRQPGEVQPLQETTEFFFFSFDISTSLMGYTGAWSWSMFFGSAQNRTHYSSWDLTGPKHNRKIILPVLPDRLPVINPRAQFPWQEHDLLTHPGFVTSHNVHLLFHKTATVDPCLLCVHRAILCTYPFCGHLLTHTL